MKQNYKSMCAYNYFGSSTTLATAGKEGNDLHN